MGCEGGTVELGPGQGGIVLQPDSFPHLRSLPTNSVFLELVSYTKPGSLCSMDFLLNGGELERLLLSSRYNFQPDLHRVSTFTISKQRASLLNNSDNLGNKEAT